MSDATPSPFLLGFVLMLGSFSQACLLWVELSALRPLCYLSFPFLPSFLLLRATGIIRTFEQANGLDRLPIIALTAHAMLGDREKCIEAGMGMLRFPLRLSWRDTDAKRAFRRLLDQAAA